MPCCQLDSMDPTIVLTLEGTDHDTADKVLLDERVNNQDRDTGDNDQRVFQQIAELLSLDDFADIAHLADIDLILDQDFSEE